MTGFGSSTGQTTYLRETTGFETNKTSGGILVMSLVTDVYL